jgi:hypothetical protein
MKKNYFKSLMQAAVLVCTPLVIASCDDVFGDTDNPIPAYMSIKQSEINLVLHAATPEKATATRTAIAATGAEVVYSSSNEKVATVDAKTGVITGVGEGTCDIIAEVTGKDSNGRNTYQPQKASFSVSVKDYRARVALKEGVTIPVFNSALAKTVEEIDLKDVLEVWPAKDTKGLTVTFTKVENTKDKGDIDPNDVIDGTKLAAGKVALNVGKVGVAKIIAEIKAGDVPEGFEQKSFKDNQKTAALTIEVKQGVAYVSGYDAKGEPVTKYMFKDYNNEKYTNLSEVLKDKNGYQIYNDVTLDAGWYYLDQDLDFWNNLRIKGDVNIILGDGCSLPNANSISILDESAKQTYKLNIFAETKNATATANFNKIVDFKEVNVFGSKLTTFVDKVVNVNINGGQLGTLVGTGDVNVTDGTAGYIEGFANVTLKKVAKAANPLVGNLYKIGTVTIPAGTQAGDLNTVTTATIKGTVGNLNNIETLTVEKATIGNMYSIGTADITETEIYYVSGVTTLNLKKVTSNGYNWYDITTLNIDKDSKIGKTSTLNWNRIGTANINGAEVETSTMIVNALKVNGGDVKAYYQIKGFKGSAKAGYTDADAKVTMTDGKLTVSTWLGGTEFAVRGDVEVTKGEFFAQSYNYHAVSGALVGTFYGSTDNATWTKITGEERPKYITTIEPKK